MSELSTTEAANIQAKLDKALSEIRICCETVETAVTRFAEMKEISILLNKANEKQKVTLDSYHFRLQSLEAAMARVQEKLMSVVPVVKEMNDTVNGYFAKKGK